MPPDTLLPLAVIVPPAAVVVLPVAIVVPPVALLPLAVAVPPLAIVVPPIAVVELPVTRFLQLSLLPSRIVVFVFVVVLTPPFLPLCF